MNIRKTVDGNSLGISLAGRLDTGTAPQLEEVIKQSVEGMTTLVIDMAELDYISSAGLRVLLSAQKVMKKQGEMIVKAPNESIMEVFEVTGFVDFLTIRQV